jgi:hypothetical protein
MMTTEWEAKLNLPPPFTKVPLKLILIVPLKLKIAATNEIFSVIHSFFSYILPPAFSATDQNDCRDWLPGPTVSGASV